MQVELHLALGRARNAETSIGLCAPPATRRIAVLQDLGRAHLVETKTFRVEQYAIAIVVAFLALIMRRVLELKLLQTWANRQILKDLGVAHNVATSIGHSAQRATRRVVACQDRFRAPQQVTLCSSVRLRC